MPDSRFFSVVAVHVNGDDDPGRSGSGDREMEK